MPASQNPAQRMSTTVSQWVSHTHTHTVSQGRLQAEGRVKKRDQVCHWWMQNHTNSAILVPCVPTIQCYGFLIWLIKNSFMVGPAGTHTIKKTSLQQSEGEQTRDPVLEKHKEMGKRCLEHKTIWWRTRGNWQLGFEHRWARERSTVRWQVWQVNRWFTERATD